MSKSEIFPEVKLNAPLMKIGGETVTLSAVCGNEMTFAGSGVTAKLSVTVKA